MGSGNAPLNPARNGEVQRHTIRLGLVQRPEFAASFTSVNSGRPLRYGELTPFGNADSLVSPTQRIKPKIAG